MQDRVVFSIFNEENTCAKINITEVYDKNFWGGRDFVGVLSVKTSNISFVNNSFYFSSQDVIKFYNELQKCHQTLEGSANYTPTSDGSALNLSVNFTKLGQCLVSIKSEDFCQFCFEFETNQSYIVETLELLTDFVREYSN